MESLLLAQCPQTSQVEEQMRVVPYALVVGSLMYAMLCTRPDRCFTVGMVNRYQLNPPPQHWIAVKHMLKYLRRTRDYVLVYQCDDLTATGYTDSDSQSNCGYRKSTSGYVFTLGGGAISWRSVKQFCIADSTMKAEYVAANEAAKEAVLLKKFLADLCVMRIEQSPITLFCNNSKTVTQSKEPRNHRRGKYIEHKYHIIREIVARGDTIVEKIPSVKNLADPFTKTLP
jgi:hypothetical protein